MGEDQKIEVGGKLQEWPGNRWQAVGVDWKAFAKLFLKNVERRVVQT